MSNGNDSRQLAVQEENLLAYDGKDRVISSNEFWEMESKKPKIEIRFKTGLPTLDRHMDGIETGEVIVVSGPTKHGKTTFCDTISRNMVRAGVKCLWFSFEVKPKYFLEKFKEDVIYIPLELKTGNLSWLAEKVFEAKLKYDCRVIYIDHLHFIVDMARMKNPSLEIGSVMRFLKHDIAIKHNVAVFLISHVTKLKFDQEPSENDIRDSSFITQEADSTLMVYRRLEEGKNAERDENPYSNKARVVVCNHRRTGAMRARVNLIKTGNDLVEETSEEVPSWVS